MSLNELLELELLDAFLSFGIIDFVFSLCVYKNYWHY